jgi:hypothetical protein
MMAAASPRVGRRVALTRETGLSNGMQTAVLVRLWGPLFVVGIGLSSSASAQDHAVGPASDGESLDAGTDAGSADLDFGATAEVQPPQPTARALAPSEMRDVPGSFGDPFRVLDTLPGVVPFYSGLPYVYVRGAPPAGTVYVYDDIAVPTLFHLALGPAVIHPALIGDLEFYAAVPPARYGRRTGGVFAAQGLRAGPRAPGHGELELRLLDAQAMIDAPLGDSRITLAGRYGYPGLLLSVFAENVALAYWDYQTRFVTPLTAHDRVEFTWFGSYDYLGEQADDQDSLTLEFHRAEARLVREFDDKEFGLAVQGGYEYSSLSDRVAVTAWRVGPRVWSKFAPTSHLRVRLGADMFATVGGISAKPEDAVSPPLDLPPKPAQVVSASGTPTRPPTEPNFAQRLVDYSFSENATLFDDPYSAVPSRNQGGAFADLALSLSGWTLAPGLRFDTWISGGDAQAAIEPRLTVTWQLDPVVALHVASGLGHQLAALPVPLPGFNDVALEHGLQEAIQNEMGVALALARSLHLDAELFYARFSNLLLPELFIECLDDTGSRDFCPTDDRLPRGNVDAYGLEVFLKRDIKERVSGWLSYTLGWADGHAPGGIEFTPASDVRHVGNVVLQVRLGAGFTVGTRVHYRSGKLAGDDVWDTISPTLFGPVRIERRLPGFFRSDAEITYGWTTHWGRMRTSLEWMNVTLSREASDITCDLDSGDDTPACKVDYAPAIFFPNLAVRAEF